MSNTANGAKGTAVITGASSGLGKVYADRLAQRGYDLLLIARREDRLKALADECISKYGVAVETLVADLGNEEDLKRVAARLGSDPGLTMLVNNAGTSASGVTGTLPYSKVEQVMHVNEEAVTCLTLAVVPGFREKNSGTVINVGSVLGFFEIPSSTTYSATKAHVMLFTMGLQKELASTNIRVQLVMPASTATEIWDVAGYSMDKLDPTTIMTAEDCVDACLAGLDAGESITLPSVEDMSLWTAFEEARTKLFIGTQRGSPASRYKLHS